MSIRLLVLAGLGWLFSGRGPLSSNESVVESAKPLATTTTSAAAITAVGSVSATPSTTLDQAAAADGIDEPLPIDRPLADAGPPPPTFLFVFGDSLTSSEFKIDGPKPSLDNPMGNPEYPGLTSAGWGLPNWIDVLTTHAPANTLTYNLANGASVCDISLDEGHDPQRVPDFIAQAQTFVEQLATGDRQPYANWTTTNSIFIPWFGHNDVYMQNVHHNHSLARLDGALSSFFITLTTLYDVGARQFLIMGIPPMWIEPAWRIEFNTVLEEDMSDVVHLSSGYWTNHMRARMEEWKRDKPNVKLMYYDVSRDWDEVLDDPGKYGLSEVECLSRFIESGDCVWWDFIHPTETTQRLLGNSIGELLVSEGMLSSYSPALSNYKIPDGP